METKRTTPLKAIRLKCLDCCCGSVYEVKMCPVKKLSSASIPIGKEPKPGRDR